MCLIVGRIIIRYFFAVNPHRFPWDCDRMLAGSHSALVTRLLAGSGLLKHVLCSIQLSYEGV